MKKNSTKLIFEIGVNHNGSLKIAKKLILIASKLKADFVKFQGFQAKNIASKQTLMPTYQKKYSKEKNKFDLLKKYEFDLNQFKELNLYAKKKKIKFLISVFDDYSILIVKKLKLKYIKIPSGEITNIPLIKKVSQLGKKVIMSTGMASIEEIEFAYKILRKNLSKKDISILHCTSLYPAPDESLNLNYIDTLKAKFPVGIGYSDHSTNLIVPIICASKNIIFYERHFTLNKKMRGPDHKASSDPYEMKKIVSLFRETEKILGKFSKKIDTQEIKMRKLARRSIFAFKDIKKGDKFTTDNLILLRPESGLHPKYLDKITNKKSKKSFKKNQAILNEI